MTDDNYKDMVLLHDKHIDALTSAVDVLTTNLTDTNDKLQNVVDLITKQNVLAERVSNMDYNTGESFNRAWSRIEKLEAYAASPKDCVSKSRIDGIEDEITTIRHDIKDIELTASSFIKGETLKWVFVGILGYSIAFGTYVVSSLHLTDTAIKEYVAKDSTVEKATVKRLDDIVSIIRSRNDNIITSSSSVNSTLH